MIVKASDEAQHVTGIAIKRRSAKEFEKTPISSGSGEQAKD
jgi:hypothetical protein